MTTSYQEFVSAKMAGTMAGSIDSELPLNGHLFDYQRVIVRWALRKGRAAVFADCGLGKTFVQLEWARVITESIENAAVLILCPLAVAQQTCDEAERFGIDIRYLRKDDHQSGIIITNYEMVHHFDMSRFTGLVLDESSILKSYDGKFRTMILRLAQPIPYRLACTATPAPNDHMELGNHAQFVGVMSREEMLASFFIHDTSGGTNSWRIKGHAQDIFWAWVCSWAVCIRHPSDIGYDEDGYDLPELIIEEHVVETPSNRRDGCLFQMNARTLSELRSEQRRTSVFRASEVMRIVEAETDEPWIVWCHTNAEADVLMSLLDDAVEIRGNEAPEIKADKMRRFASGDIRVLVTKPKIAAFGLNWQHCARQAWIGITHSYESFYQAVRRCWRFGQTRPVVVHVVCADTETEVLRSLETKQRKADQMSARMVKSMKNVEMENAETTTAYSDEYMTQAWEDPDGLAQIYHGDCVETWRSLPDESIDFTIFSPPFSSLFTYSASPRDMGNVSDDKEFIDHFNFLIPELFRTTRTGRLCAVHCMNLTSTKSRQGFIGLRDFRGDIIRAFVEAGWVYHSEVCIWKDPVTSMQRTKAHGLLHATLCKDSARSRQGLPDYLVIFRKDGDCSSPVRTTPTARFSDYIGEQGPTTDQEQEPRRYSIDVWQRYASPVWFDINQTRTLNYRPARQERDERHICPLQLDVIERAIHLWSNEGDLVATPFMGIGSEVVSAVKMGRRGIGAELKRSYYEMARSNIIDAIAPDAQLSLLDIG